MRARGARVMPATLASQRPLELIGAERRMREFARALRAQPVEDDAEVAPPGRSCDVGDTADHELDQRHVGEGDVVAQVAAGLGAADQLLDERRDAAARGRHALRDGAAGGEDHLLQRAVGDVQLDRGLEEVLQPLPRVVALERPLGQRDEVIDPLLEERIDELVLVGEAPVRGAHAHAGMARDLVQADGEALLREELAGGIEDPLAVALGVSSQLRHVSHNSAKTETSSPVPATVADKKRRESLQFAYSERTRCLPPTPTTSAAGSSWRCSASPS